MLPARSYLLQKLGLINLHWLSHRYLQHAGIKAAAQRDKPMSVSPASCRVHTLRVACVGILQMVTADQGGPPQPELLPPTLTASAASVHRVTAVSICAVPTHQLLIKNTQIHRVPLLICLKHVAAHSRIHFVQSWPLPGLSLNTVFAFSVVPWVSLHLKIYNLPFPALCPVSLPFRLQPAGFLGFPSH